MDTSNDPNNQPTLADIVRRETNNGETLVRFYLDVVEGKLDDEGFEACHKLEAAEQVHAVAPGLVADYIAENMGVECVHAIRRRRTRDGNRSRRSRAGGNPSPTNHDFCVPRANRHPALEYLADVLNAPPLADDPRVTGIVRASTDHGMMVVSYLIHVMHGSARGYRLHHRMDAAKELLGHIARDEIRAQSTSDNSVIPAEAGIQNDEPATSVIPAQAGIQGGGDEAGSPSSPSPSTGEGRGEGDSSAPSTVKPPADYRRGCYNTTESIAHSMWRPAHPIHKFIKAYDEVADAFLKEGHDDDFDAEAVRLWIAGDIPDMYGKFISQYCPHTPTPVIPRRPKRQRRPTPAGKAVFQEMMADKMRREGTLTDTRTDTDAPTERPRLKIWV